MKIAKAEEVEGYDPLPSITRKELARTKNFLLSWNELRGHALIPPHNHPEEQASFVLQGRLEFTVGGKKVVVGPGESVWFESWEKHEGRGLDDRVVVLDIHSPPLKKVFYESRNKTGRGIGRTQAK